MDGTSIHKPRNTDVVIITQSALSRWSDSTSAQRVFSKVRSYFDYTCTRGSHKKIASIYVSCALLVFVEYDGKKITYAEYLDHEIIDANVAKRYHSSNL